MNKEEFEADLEFINKHLPITHVCLLVTEAFANPEIVKLAVAELKLAMSNKVECTDGCTG